LKRIKRKYKILISIAIFFFVILPLTLYLLLRLPSVQTYITQKIAAHFSKKLNTEISVGGIDISWFLDIVIEDVVVKDLHNNQALKADKLIIDIEKINFKKNHISIGAIELKNTNINLFIYENQKDMNIQFIIDYFMSNDSTEEQAPWTIDIRDVKLNNISFAYRDFNQVLITKGIDFNNLLISGLKTEISDIKILEDTMYAHIMALSCSDHSGFVFDNLKGKLKINDNMLKIDDLIIQTPKSDISLNLTFNYDSYNDFNNFVENVSIEALFNPSKLYLNDIAYFAPDLFGLNNVLDLTGNFTGKIVNLRGRNVEIKTGMNTYFAGNFSLTGLPDIDETYINLNAKQLTTCYNDISGFKLPGDTASGLELPEQLKKLGVINFRGNFTGFTKDFVAYGNINTEIGSIRTDISLKKNNADELTYNGNIMLNKFNIGKILNNEENLGYISTNLNVKGKGFDFETVDVKLNGKILNIQLNNYFYNNISIAGNLANKTFTGFIDIKDENIDLDFEGTVDLRKELPVFDFSSSIRYAKLNKLNITEEGIDRKFSAYMKCRFKGKTFEDISGIFLIDNVKFVQEDKQLHLKKLQINNTSGDNHYKNIVLNSEIFDINLEGFFSYADLPASFSGFINKYLPSYKKDTIHIKDTTISTAFRYDIKFKGANDLLQFFVPHLSLEDNLNLYGNFNYEKDLFTIDGLCNKIRYDSTLISGFIIKGTSDEMLFNVSTSANKISLTSDISIDDVYLNTFSKNDSILIKVNWDNKASKARNNGIIDAFVSFDEFPLINFKFLDASVFINDSLWVLNKGNNILFDSSSIRISNLLFRHNKEVVALDGRISKNPKDHLKINFSNFNIADFNPLLKKEKIEVQGILQGHLSLFDVYNTPNFISDLKIEKLVVNDDLLGSLSLKSTWEPQLERLEINSDVTWEGAVGSRPTLLLNGYYYPYAQNDNMDIDIQLLNFHLSSLKNLFSSFSSNFTGYAIGNLSLKGNFDKPRLNGNIDLKHTSLKVDYLNTTVVFRQNIIFEDNYIHLDSLILNNSKGYLSGYIYHDYFKDFRLDLKIIMNNLMCLNTGAADNNLFYGTAYVTGNTRIHGPIDKIVMDVYAKTDRNTRFYLPLTSTGEVSENTFIKFINKDTSTIAEVMPTQVDVNGIQINFDLEATSDAELQIIFDSKIGDIIKAKGNGNIKMEVNTIGDFKMFGDYIIEDGDYLFTLQNFINKKFHIQKGSQISWTGDPYNAIANVNAVYSLRTPLYDLVFFADSSEEYKKRMPVNCLLGMKGNLFNPEISFDLELPGSDEKTKNLVATILNSEAEINRQMFALLALNRFLPPAGLNEFSNVNITTGLEATSTEMLSNQLSNWLSQISKDFDIGVNYRAGDKMSSDEVEVALSTQINDRLSIDGSVGTSSNKQNASQIVGDVNVELKLTEDGKFRMKFYNKSNSVDMLKLNAPYTQGVGLFYRKEFDSFKELFNRKP